MEPTNDVKKTDKRSTGTGNSSSELDTLLNTLRKTGITAILTMNKKAQMAMSNWAHDLVSQYNAVLKNNPMKLKDIRALPCSKIDAKLAIKLLLMASVPKGIEDDIVVDLRNKFISLGSFQSIDQEDLLKLEKYLSGIQKKSMDIDVSSFPELNKYMNMIISEQKVLLHEINSFIEDIRKIKKNF
ncbi:MAG: hypothetical protein WBY47_05515 [Desulfobacterales bacterium]